MVGLSGVLFIALLVLHLLFQHPPLVFLVLALLILVRSCSHFHGKYRVFLRHLFSGTSKCTQKSLCPTKTFSLRSSSCKACIPCLSAVPCLCW